MSKKKNDVEDFKDIFSNLKKSTEEIEQLSKQIEAEEPEALAQVEQKTASAIPVLQQAFGIHKDATSGKWCVAELRYDPTTGHATVHNDTALTTVSKSVALARASELLTRVSLGLTIKNVRGYK